MPQMFPKTFALHALGPSKLALLKWVESQAESAEDPN
jgi:hypothetical protein